METKYQTIPARAARAGFTLIELVVVILIVGIMAFAVMPRFNLLQGFDGTGYADQVAAWLRWAQKSALAQRRLTALEIPADSSAGLRLCIASNYTANPVCPADCDDAAMQALSPPGGAARIPKTTVNVSNAGILCFFPDNGRASVTSTRVLTFTDSNGSPVKSVSIEAGSGYVH